MNRVRKKLGEKVGKLPSDEKSSILDVKGVSIGHKTLNYGQGKLNVGNGPVRTGVTAILPTSENIYQNPLCCSVLVANGYGKSTGFSQVEELGALESPVFLTNTMSVGTVWQGATEYVFSQNPELGEKGQTINPVVGECNDGYLNDIHGKHVKKEHVFGALQNLSDEDVTGGNVGAGTGMVAFGFKGGIGHSSRKISYNNCGFTIGCLVLANYGKREQLMFEGVPVGEKFPLQKEKGASDGSIMIILATDLPLESRQLKRICKRAPLGLARTGSVMGHGSGDFVLAFSTTNILSKQGDPIYMSKKVREKGGLFNLVFQGVVEAVAEAVYDALVQAETMIGRDDRRVEALPPETINFIRGGSSFEN